MRVLFVLYLALGSPVGAEQGDQLAISIRPGFGGFYKIGSHLSVEVTIENRETDLSGWIEVEIAGARSSTPVSLPAPSRKSYALDLRAEEHSSEVRVRLFAGERSWEARTKLSPLARDTKLLVVAHAESPRLDLAPGDVGSRARTAHVAGRDLPTSWRAYRGIDRLVLEGPAAGALGPLQRAALTRWLQVGGRLAVTSEHPESLRPLLLEFAPFDMNARHEEDQAEFRWGLGSLLLVPAGTRSLEELRSLLPAADGEEAWRSDFATLRSAAESTPFLPRPAGTLLVGGLLYFCTLAGVSLVARRRRKPLPSLSTTAAVVVAFGVGALFVGRLADGAGLAVREHVLVQIFPESREAFVVSLVDYVSRRRQKIELRSSFDGGDLEIRKGPPAAGSRLDAGGRRVVSLDAGTWTRGTLVSLGFLNVEQRLPAGRGASELLRGLSESGLSDCRYLADGRPVLATDPPEEASAAGAGNRASPAILADEARRRELQRRPREEAAGTRGGSPRQALVCSMTDIPIGLESDPRVDRVAGDAVAVVYLPSSADEGQERTEVAR